MKTTGRFDDGEFVCVWDMAQNMWAVKVRVFPKSTSADLVTS